MNEKGVIFKAGEPILAQSEVFNNYSLKGNENLLENYGFVLEENPEDYYKIFLNIHKSDPLFVQKQESLSRQSNNSSNHLLFADNEFPKDLLPVSRILCANFAELQLINECVVKNGNMYQMINLRNEFISMKTLWELLSNKKKLLIADESFMNVDIGADETTALAAIYKQGLLRVLDSSLDTLKGMAMKLLPPKSKNVSSFFFSIQSPIIDPDFLNLVSDESLDFDDDTILSLCALKYLPDIPKRQLSPFLMYFIV
jgi:hypothetical protein